MKEASGPEMRTSRVDRGGVPARAAGWMIAGLVRAVRVVRSPRPIHPAGVVVAGTVKPSARRAASGARSGIAWIDEPPAAEIVGRISRGIGTPVPMPDIWGLALRLPGDDAGVTGVEPLNVGNTDTGGGDLLLSSVGNLGVPWRFVPVARLSPHGAVFATVMPYRSDQGPVLLGARTVSGAPASASATGIATELSRTPWLLELMWATPRGLWRPFATVSLTGSRDAVTVGDGGDRTAVDDPELRFDPVLSPPPGAGTYGWTRALREPAYRIARRG